MSGAETVSASKMQRNPRRARWRQHIQRAMSMGKDAGMVSAEYAIVTLAACGFAGLLLAVVTSGEVRQMLTALIHRALSIG